MQVASSHAKGDDVFPAVAAECLCPGERVLVADDFLASGATIVAMARLADRAQATFAGGATAIVKRFEDGRQNLACIDGPIVSVVVVADMIDGTTELE